MLRNFKYMETCEMINIEIMPNSEVLETEMIVNLWCGFNCSVVRSRRSESLF